MRSQTYKLIVIAAIAGLSFLAVGNSAKAQACSTAILEGMYSASFHTDRLGLLSGSPPILDRFATPDLVDGVEVFTFDGAGNFSNLDFAMRNGTPAAAGQSGLTPDGFQTQTGTYTVNSDCTGSGTMSQPGMDFTFVMVVGNGGRTLRLVATSLHMAVIPNNPNCTAPAGCEVAIQSSTVGEKVVAGKRSN